MGMQKSIRFTKELLKFNELLLVANGWELQRIGSDYKEALRLIKIFTRRTTNCNQNWQRNFMTTKFKYLYQLKSKLRQGCSGLLNTLYGSCEFNNLNRNTGKIYKIRIYLEWFV